MELTAHKKVKVFRSKQEIERLLVEQAQSGLSVKAFCAGVQIAEGIFYHWREKYGKSKSGQKTGFAPVEIVPTEATACLLKWVA